MALPFICNPTPEPSHVLNRVSNPTESTPATFDIPLYSENGPLDPPPAEAVATFMGPKEEAEGREKMIGFMVEVFKKEGFRTSAGETGGEDAYNDEMEPVSIRGEGGVVVAVIDSTEDWIYIRCSNPQISEIVAKQFTLLARLDHVSTIIHESDNETSDPNCTGVVSVTQSTGNPIDENHSNSGLGMLFELKVDDKVIARALCSYANGEMAMSCPTIETFETAQEWRHQGFGYLLMQIVEQFFEEKLKCLIM